MLALPASGQDLPPVTPEETAAAIAAVEAAGLSDTAYRALWCAGAYSVIGQSQPRDTLYRQAAMLLIHTGMDEAAFTAIAEHVYRVALSQMRTGTTTRDFSDADCSLALTP
jgi:hypothetical protein